MVAKGDFRPAVNVHQLRRGVGGKCAHPRLHVGESSCSAWHCPALLLPARPCLVRLSLVRRLVGCLRHVFTLLLLLLIVASRGSCRQRFQCIQLVLVLLSCTLASRTRNVCTGLCCGSVRSGGACCGRVRRGGVGFHQCRLCCCPSARNLLCCDRWDRRRCRRQRLGRCMV